MDDCVFKAKYCNICRLLYSEMLVLSVVQRVAKVRSSIPSCKTIIN